MDTTTQSSTIRQAPALHSRPARLLSLDVMRGGIMILLALESAGLYEHLIRISENTAIHPFFLQFEHHPWHGLHAWDLVQPAFMFMAGAALAFSLRRQQVENRSWGYSFRKALRRSGWLFFWGVLDYAVRRSGLSFELWDVLTQLSFTSLLAFLIFRWPVPAQLAVCAGLLLLTEALYRFAHIPGFDQPFTDQHNLGNYVDLLLMNKINKDGWVAINCIPTAVHTIAGALAGRLLLNPTAAKKATRLVGWGVLCLLLGYTLDLAGITPIIKRIATSSFVLVSLGYSLLILAVCYWFIDIRDHRKHWTFFTIVGMNSIFIYLFFEIVAHRWFNGYVAAFTGTGILTSLVIFACEWGLCYFLYKKKIFFKV